MTNNKYKILVLSDMKGATVALLKNTMGLAKMINGEVEFFHVKKPTEIVERESQLSAVREINEQYFDTDNKIKQVLDPISKTYDIKVKSKHAFGNIKDEIESHIKETAPDIIVLGKRKAKAIAFLGDNVTEFVLKKHKGAIMIASEDDSFDSKRVFSLGVLNEIETSLNKNLAQNLIDVSEVPLKLFKIGGFANADNASDATDVKKTVEYVFENNANVIQTISDYVSKNNISLLCLDRGQGNSQKASYAKDAINKVNVSLLVT